MNIPHILYVLIEDGHISRNVSNYLMARQQSAYGFEYTFDYSYI